MSGSELEDRIRKLEDQKFVHGLALKYLIKLLLPREQHARSREELCGSLERLLETQRVMPGGDIRIRPGLVVAFVQRGGEVEEKAGVDVRVVSEGATDGAADAVMRIVAASEPCGLSTG